MSEEQFKVFLEMVKGDTSLQEKLKAAQSPEDVLAIAKEHGHEFTADKITELSEEELEVVSGGANTSPPVPVNCKYNTRPDQQYLTGNKIYYS